MKRFKIELLTIALATILAVGCDAFHSVSTNKVTSQGAPYELIVVSNQPQWEGALGDSLRSVLTAPIPYLQQTEPIFDVLRVTEQGYSNLVTRHRNIFRTLINPAIDSTSVAVQYDLTASPQIVMTLQGPSEEALAQYLGNHREAIVTVLERAERDRAIDYAEKFSATSLEQLIEQKFGFKLKIPQGYTLRNEGDDFVWISYEYPTASQGVLIYSHPATRGVLSLTAEELVEARNKYAAKIPGPSDGSYMTTFMDYAPDYRLFRLDGRIWAEMHGLWEVEGDFMGGPYVSFSTINTNTDDVVTIDAYVFSPKLGKRNFIRGVEHLLYGATFPDVESNEE